MREVRSSIVSICLLQQKTAFSRSSFSRVFDAGVGIDRRLHTYPLILRVTLSIISVGYGSSSGATRSAIQARVRC